MNAKLTQQKFRPNHKNGLIKMMSTIPHDLCVNVKSASLLLRFRDKLGWALDQREADLKLTYRLGDVNRNGKWKFIVSSNMRGHYFSFQSYFFIKETRKTRFYKLPAARFPKTLQLKFASKNCKQTLQVKFEFKTSKNHKKKMQVKFLIKNCK